MTGFDDLVGALAQFQHDNADTRERRLVRVAVARARKAWAASCAR